ncbi:GNAT family N-acetyltransferase [Xanthomarina sp. F2636L]|uniref:GNAT family N-acetyltransferase n=1 Tax=Xanthomarina sp. F2636L TaxID=2996018 RepID=UPI00225DD34C|nr:GNAT family protein [Xanthomarina sp. F2636L]MCX7549815.1 GNAT family protein [Xanthomarina sp. F2636L]
MNIPFLENSHVKLSLLDLSNYTHLQDIAAENDLIFYSPSDISTLEKFKEYVQVAVDGYYHKTIIPFIIYDKTKQAYAGSTRFGLINWENKTLHIGWTWLGRDFHGTGLNKQIKFLMLQYAFETLEFEKVEFRIDERNVQSRKAVEKIGASLEGILRKDTLMQDGYRRNTCCYGILKEEWPDIKTNIFSKTF